MNNNTFSSCFVCGRLIPPGAERLILLNHTMCSCCEKTLVNTSIEEDRYQLFKEKIKRLWLN